MACYGLGIFSKFTTQNFMNYAKDIITALIKTVKLPIDKKLPKTDKENLKFARDNAVSALANEGHFDERT